MLTTDIRAGWTRARRLRVPAARSAWGRMDVAQVACSGSWGRADALEGGAALQWAGHEAKDDVSVLLWGGSQARDDAAGLPFGDLPAQDLRLGGSWNQSIQRVDLRIIVAYNPAPARKDAEAAPRYHRVDEHGPRYDAALERDRSLYVPGTLLAFNFAGGRYTPASTPGVFFDFRYVPPARVIQPVDSSTALQVSSARQIGRFLRLLWGRARALDPVPTGIEVPRL